jgi:hypothetical protein
VKTTKGRLLEWLMLIESNIRPSPHIVHVPLHLKVASSGTRRGFYLNQESRRISTRRSTRGPLGETRTTIAGARLEWQEKSHEKLKNLPSSIGKVVLKHPEAIQHRIHRMIERKPTRSPA